MPTGFIEINDAGLSAWIDGELLLTSPGYAVMDGTRLLVGEEGIRNSRLLPRWTNNRFWNQLGTEPIPNGTELVRHHADIALAHLEHVWHQIGGQAEQVILAVPGYYSRAQLGLLLGIARECNLPVVGLVDTSLAAVCHLPAHRTLLHLDIFLHRITLTVLRAETLLQREQTITISETGLFALWDRWANIIASQFIQTSRYDPMHQAVSEQQLFDKLPAWIESLAGERSSTFALEIGSTRHQVAVSREQLLAACATIYPQIVQLVRDHAPPGDNASLFVSHRFRGFPGLEDSLALIDNVDLVQLEPASTSTGITAFKDQIASPVGPVSHTTSLPATGLRPESRPRERRASHLLLDHHALPIGNALHIGLNADGKVAVNGETPLLTLYIRGRQTLLDNQAVGRVNLNGEPAPAQSEVHPGDRLEIEGRSLTLVSVG